jgi:hypothetical protein
MWGKVSPTFLVQLLFLAPLILSNMTAFLSRAAEGLRNAVLGPTEAEVRVDKLLVHPIKYVCAGVICASFSWLADLASTGPARPSLSTKQSTDRVNCRLYWSRVFRVADFFPIFVLFSRDAAGFRESILRFSSCKSI